MREPTLDPLFWWREALAGRRLPTHEDEAHCGFFKTRKPGPEPWQKRPMVPARIWIEQPLDPETGELIGDEVMRCEIDGELWPILEGWVSVARQPITRDEYVALLESRFVEEILK